jgi:hypothetical protein
LGTGLASSRAAVESVVPVACHTANRPLVFCKLISKSGLLTKTVTLLVAKAGGLLPSLIDQEIVRLLGPKARAEANVIESSSAWYAAKLAPSVNTPVVARSWS